MKLNLAKLKEFLSLKKKKVFNEKRIIRNQKFRFHASLIDYIISSHPWILEKLNQTCKYWFAKYHCIFSNTLEYTYYGPSGYDPRNNRGQKKPSSIVTEKTLSFAHPSTFDKIPPLKICLTHTLYFDTSPIERIKNFSHTISSRLEQIYLCRLKMLIINFQNLNFAEWNFMTSSKTIEIVDLRESYITHCSNKKDYVYIEDLLVNLINAVEIYFLLSPKHFSTETEHKLFDIQFNAKFLQFHLGVIPLTFNFEAFVFFAQKNAAYKAEVTLYNNENDIMELYLRIKDNYFGNAKNLFRSNYQNVKVWISDRRYFDCSTDTLGKTAVLLTSF